jgi:hypothetical protein
VPPRPQPRLSLSIGDATLPILGAKLRSGSLHLSTAPLDCGPIIPDRDLDLHVMLGPGLHARHVFAGGDRLPPLPSALDGEPLSITAVGQPDPAAPIATLAINGTLGPELERPIRLSGVVDALRCADR